MYVYLYDLSDWPCGGTLTEHEGELASPNWPNNYQPSTTCVWNLVAPKGAKIQINFLSIDLEEHITGNCQSAYDYVHVFEGSNVTDVDVTFCGQSDSKEIFSSNNDLIVTFRSDERVQRSGFHALYQFILPEVSTLQTTVPSTEVTYMMETTESFSTKLNISKEIHMSLTALFMENKRKIPKSNDFVHELSTDRNKTQKEEEDNTGKDRNEFIYAEIICCYFQRIVTSQHLTSLNDKYRRHDIIDMNTTFNIIWA